MGRVRCAGEEPNDAATLYLGASVRHGRSRMPDESDPPRKFFQLKPREFETVNNPPRVPGETTAKEEAEAAQGRIDVQKIIKPANAAGPVLTPKSRAPPSNEVHAILRDNL